MLKIHCRNCCNMIYIINCSNEDYLLLDQSLFCRTDTVLIDQGFTVLLCALVQSGPP